AIVPHQRFRAVLDRARIPMPRDGHRNLCTSPVQVDASRVGCRSETQQIEQRVIPFVARAADSPRMAKKVTPPAAVVAALHSSGFPFQTAVRREIEAAAPGGRRVEATEYSWQTADGETHFLDLVATNGVIHLTIECKKTRKEILTFL